MAGLSDGAIVGSAIVKLCKEYGENAPEHIREYVQAMCEAVHGKTEKNTHEERNMAFLRKTMSS